jgi:hypothetical protein
MTTRGLLSSLVSMGSPVFTQRGPHQMGRRGEGSGMMKVKASTCCHTTESRGATHSHIAGPQAFFLKQLILTSLDLHTILLIPVYDEFKDQRFWSF